MSEQSTEVTPEENPLNPLNLLSKGGESLAALWVAKSSIDIYREVVAAVVGALDPKTDDPKAAAEQYSAQVDLAHSLAKKAVNRQLLFIKENVQELLFGKDGPLPELVALGQMYVEGKFAEEMATNINRAVESNNSEWNKVAASMKQRVDQLTAENGELAKQLAGKLSATDAPPALPATETPPAADAKPRNKAAKQSGT